MCVRTCMCHGKLCDTLIGRDKKGVLVCLPDGGVTGSEFASFCGVLMNAGTSRGDETAV